MILGIGSDITDIRRIEKVIAKHGERFLNRIFTETERARAERRAKMTPPGMEARIDLSITDEYPLAQAFVIISAVPAGTPGG
jgi:phosphopantetheinyl transferase (holo-ACP synthase)